MPCDPYRNHVIVLTKEYLKFALFDTGPSHYLGPHVSDAPPQVWVPLPERHLASGGSKRQEDLLYTEHFVLWGVLATRGIVLTQSMPC